MKIENNVDNTLKNCCRFEQAILARGCVNIKKFGKISSAFLLLLIVDISILL